MDKEYKIKLNSLKEELKNKIEKMEYEIDDLISHIQKAVLALEGQLS